jgi:hypothetical protein
MNADLALPPVMVVRTDDTEDSSMPRKLCFSVGTLEKKLSLFFLLNWMPIFIIDVFCNVTGEEFIILQLFFKCVSVFFFFPSNFYSLCKLPIKTFVFTALINCKFVTMEYTALNDFVGSLNTDRVSGTVFPFPCVCLFIK